jgi:hypothetical protein
MVIPAVVSWSQECSVHRPPGALLASLRPVASGIIADVTSEQRRGKVKVLERLRI